jgi:hypothetical protein
MAVLAIGRNGSRSNKSRLTLAKKEWHSSEEILSHLSFHCHEMEDRQVQIPAGCQ